MTVLIRDGQSLNGAKSRFGYDIATYDDSFGPLWISRDSIGINGIVRARSFEDAYGICEDEFFTEADETIEQLKTEFGFRREHKKVVKDPSVLVASEHCGVGERFDCHEDYATGRLADEMFVRWQIVETHDPEAWMDNEIFQEQYGFRPNGPNSRDTIKHGIYAKDLNGYYLDRLTPELVEELGISLEIDSEDNDN